MSDDAHITVSELGKRFYTPKAVHAVSGVSFVCHSGEVFGLLGPNGAGKTTTLRILATLLRPDEGSAEVAGHDIRADPSAVRRAIGYLSTSTGLYGRLTAQEMIEYCARLQGVENPKARTQEMMERFDITEFAHKRCDRLSTGMKQKVSIARAVVHDPPVLILDEPTQGLDVLVSQSVDDFVLESKKAGRCVLFSTHTMSEAERLCDQIAVIHQGTLLAQGTLDDLRQQTGEHYLEQVFIHLVTGAQGGS